MISIYSSDIIPNWNDMRSYFGYNMLDDIASHPKRGGENDIENLGMS
jgi:hypothetical protein